MSDLYNVTLRCPACGCEYLLSEIFYPNAVFGRPEHILRSENGDIEYFEGKGMDTEETYCCDRCGALFKSYISITATTELLGEKEFSESTTISLDKSEFTSTELW